MNLRQQIGAEMQREREKKKLTRKQVAGLAGIDERYVRLWERGALNVTADSMVKDDLEYADLTAQERQKIRRKRGFRSIRKKIILGQKKKAWIGLSQER